MRDTTKSTEMKKGTTRFTGKLQHVAPHGGSFENPNYNIIQDHDDTTEITNSTVLK